MAKGFRDTIHGRLFDVCLIDGVAQDKHIIGTDTNEHERHQLVNTRSFAPEQVEETEARCVGEEDC